MKLLPVLRVAFILTLANVPAGSPPEGGRVAPETKRMAERLESIRRQSDPMKNIYRSDERAETMRLFLDTLEDPDRILAVQPRYANELLNAGRTLEAIEAFKKFKQMAEEAGVSWDLHNRTTYRAYLALAFLRLGEQENCLLNHTSQSCLFPIQGTGIHRAQRGSRQAVDVLLEQLREIPDDLRARWLLNMCAMTLGEYPDSVPEPWRIPPQALQSKHDIKRFTDVAAQVGLDLNGLAGGVVADDFDQDGDLDIMISSFALEGQLRYFRSNGDGSFIEITHDAGLTGDVGGLNLVPADYNNDGWLDVLVLRGAWLGQEGQYPNSLLSGRADGTFVDVTEAAGVLSFHPTQTATWLDFDNDGWLDLFVGNESISTVSEKHPCELFRNNRDGTFTECAEAAGVAAIGMIKGVASADIDRDGWIDLFVSRRGQENLLFRNMGPAGVREDGVWRFTEIGRKAGVTEPIHGFSCWFFDFDNDGWADLFVGDNMIRHVGDVCADYLGLPTDAERSRLFRNRGDGTFEDVSQRLGVFHVLTAMGANFGDLDNDGWLDFYIGTGEPNLATLVPNRMFRNNEGRGFEDVTTSGGFGHLQKGHGIAFADFDNDGDQDVFAQMGGALSGDVARSALFQNPGHGHHWITLRLVGDHSNRAALGARIKVEVETDKGRRSIHRTVGTGGSFGASPLRQEIGLGLAQSISQVEIHWPVTGRTQVFKGLKLDRHYVIREADPEADLLPLKPFALGDAIHSDHQHDHP